MTHSSTEALSRRRLATGLIAVLLGAALPAIGSTLPLEFHDEELDDEETLFIGKINDDSIADTIHGRLTTSAQYRPTRITWGTERIPGTTTIPRSTRFLYPDWSPAGASISISDLNADSLADMVLYIWGEAAAAEGSARRSSSYILFGSRNADTVEAIDLANPLRNRADALFPFPIAPGGALVDRAIRDHTGIASYVRLPIGARTEEKHEPPSNERPAGVPQVTLYPNPTDDRVEIVATGLAAGRCTITMIDLDGRQLRSEPGEAGSDGTLTMTLDLKSLASGYYIVRIDDNEKIVRSLPLLVVH